MNYTGERIRFFRKRQNLTLRELGLRLGFSEHSADVRIAQYENQERVPRPGLLKRFAELFNVSTAALNVPDLSSSCGIMQLLFAMEDDHGLFIRDVDGQPAFFFDPDFSDNTRTLNLLITRWMVMRQLRDSGSISSEEYDDWRYNLSSEQEGNYYGKT